MSSLYSISIPVLRNVLAATKATLQKGAEHARAQAQGDEAKAEATIAGYLDARVYEDMMPLRMQVLIIAVTARKAVERLTGAAPPGSGELLGDLQRERALAELLALVDETDAVLAGVRPEAVDGREKERVPCAFGSEQYEASLFDYIHGYPIPTVYFHLNMIYAMLRGKGVPLGKKDYMAPFMNTFELKSTSS